MKKSNCKDYQNCVGCPYLKKTKVKNKDLKNKEEELFICEFNMSVEEMFRNNSN